MKVLIELMGAYKELMIDNFFAAIEAVKETWRNA
jgi:hypothetical protein